MASKDVACTFTRPWLVVLRGMGVLQYTAQLAEVVDAGVLVPAGSNEEVEIRACTIQAVERMKRALVARLEAEPVLAAAAALSVSVPEAVGRCRLTPG